MLPDLHVKIDGQPVHYETFSATATIGGYDQFTATITAEEARRLLSAATRRSELVVDSGTDSVCRWAGRLAGPPTFTDDGKAEIKASGYKIGAERTDLPFRAQTRDYGLLDEAQGEPYNYPEFESIGLEETDNSLRWRIEAGEAVNQGERTGVVLYAQGGTIRRCAYDWASTVASTNLTVEVLRATGPSGGLTIVTTPSLNATSGSVNTGEITSPEDLLMIRMRRTGANTASHVRYRVRATNVRIWGDRTIADTYSVASVLAAIGSDLGWDTSGVSGVLTTDCLPLWWEDSHWAELANYVCMLQDAWWRVLNDRGSGPYLEANTWANSRRWVVTQAAGTQLRLSRQEAVDGVVVYWRRPSGRLQKSEAGTTSPGSDIFSLELEDVQGSATLADAVAAAWYARLSGDRYAGDLALVSAVSGGVDDPLGVLPGDLATVDDHAIGELFTHRVYGTTLTPFGLTAHVEPEGLPERMLALASLARARRNVRAKIEKGRFTEGEWRVHERKRWLRENKRPKRSSSESAKRHQRDRRKWRHRKRRYFRSL